MVVDLTVFFTHNKSSQVGDLLGGGRRWCHAGGVWSRARGSRTAPCAAVDALVEKALHVHV